MKKCPLEFARPHGEVLFCPITGPKPRNIQFLMKYNRKQQKIHIIQRLEPVTVWYFCLMKDLHIWSSKLLRNNFLLIKECFSGNFCSCRNQIQEVKLIKNSSSPPDSRVNFISVVTQYYLIWAGASLPNILFVYSSWLSLVLSLCGFVS